MKGFKILRRTSLIDKIVTELKEKIVSGDFKDGDLLPSQDELAKSMGVSRSSIREALSRLSTMGFIESRQGVGTFIKFKKSSGSLDSISSLILKDRYSGKELLQARFIVEPAIASLAAENAVESDIEKIKSILEKTEQEFQIGMMSNFLDRDREFHRLIATTSKASKILIELLLDIRNLIPTGIYKAFSNSRPLVASALDYHTKIFKAIKEHDSIAARKFMEDHIMSVKEFFD